MTSERQHTSHNTPVPATVWHLNAFRASKQCAPNYNRQAAVAECGAAAAHSASCAAKKKVYLLNTKLASCSEHLPGAQLVFELACPAAACYNLLGCIQTLPYSIWSRVIPIKKIK